MHTDTLTTILAIAVASWAFAFLLQLIDVITGNKVKRAGRAAGTRDRDRVLVWTIAVCASMLIIVTLGVDFAARLFLDQGELLWGALVLVLLFAVGASTALLAARALRRPGTGYQVFRNELRAQSGARLTKGRLADYRSWLDTIDARENDVRRRVIVGRWVRAIPVAVAGMAIIVAIWLAAVGEFAAWQVVLCLVPVAVSTWLAIAGARTALARNLAIHAVHHKQRAEAIIMLEDLERKAPRKVAGLSERVSRALAILREQQGQDDKEH
ncbi:MAG: hypothetical protein ABIW32_08630 [Terrimesophilobacter sp.]